MIVQVWCGAAGVLQGDGTEETGGSHRGSVRGPTEALNGPRSDTGSKPVRLGAGAANLGVCSGLRYWGPDVFFCVQRGAGNDAGLSGLSSRGAGVDGVGGVDGLYVQPLPVGGGWFSAMGVKSCVHVSLLPLRFAAI